jgi:hypothetical protein
MTDLSEPSESESHLTLDPAADRHRLRQLAFGLGSVFWVVNYGVLLCAFIRRSWFGLGTEAPPEPATIDEPERAAEGR